MWPGVCDSPTNGMVMGCQPNAITPAIRPESATSAVARTANTAATISFAVSSRPRPTGRTRR